MAAPTPPFVAHCLELLECLGPMRARRMFGGWGLYQGDLIVAIIAFERLFLKTSAETRPRFEAAGCEAFVYDAKTGAVAMSYWSAPAEALDSPALMQPWARLALQAALAARAAAPKKRARKPPRPSAARARG
jgi:DNA transformation protein and related proteins